MSGEHPSIAVHRQPIERRLEPADPAKVRRRSDASADVRTDPEGRHPCGDRGRLAAGRSPAGMPERPWIRRLPEERIARLGIEHRLREVRASEKDRARLVQQRHQRCIALGDTSAPCRDAECRRLSRNVETLLDGNGHPVERAARFVASAPCVRRRRVGHGLVVKDSGKGVQAPVQRGDAIEVRAQDFLCRDFATSQHGCQPGGRGLPK